MPATRVYRAYRGVYSIYCDFGVTYIICDLVVVYHCGICPGCHAERDLHTKPALSGIKPPSTPLGILLVRLRLCLGWGGGTTGQRRFSMCTAFEIQWTAGVYFFQVK